MGVTGQKKKLVVVTLILLAVLQFLYWSVKDGTKSRDEEKKSLGNTFVKQEAKTTLKTADSAKATETKDEPVELVKETGQTGPKPVPAIAGGVEQEVVQGGVTLVETPAWIRDKVNNPWPEKLKWDYKDSKLWHSEPYEWPHFHPRPGEHLDMAKIKEEARIKYAERRKPIDEYCKHIEDNEGKSTELYKRTHWVPGMNMHYSWDHRFFGCSRLKSGFSSWQSHYKSILQYYNYPIDCDKLRCDHIQHEWFKLPRKPPTSWDDMIGDSLAFMFSRNPFTHVVSAYNYMVSGMGMQYDREQILQIYAREIKEINDARLAQGLSTKKIPPSIMVKRIMSEWKAKGYYQMNEHFRPGWSYCAVCSIKYDVIGRIDTFEEDSDFILDRLQLKDAIKSPAHQNKPRDKTSVEDFYGQLSTKEMLQLYEFYKHDFLLEGFNHTVQEYLNMAGDARS